MSKLIECIKGHTETNLSGITYAFQRDQHGRFVAEVHDPSHIECLLAVQWYRVAPDVPDADEGAEEPGQEPSPTGISPKPDQGDQTQEPVASSPAKADPATADAKTAKASQPKTATTRKPTAGKTATKKAAKPAAPAEKTTADKT